MYGAIDWFRLAAAFMIVAIHTGPFSGINGALEQGVTYGVCRIAVPFFMMVSGYFVMSGYDSPSGRKRIFQMMKKLSVLYLGVTVLYLPINYYAKNLPAFTGVIKWFLFDGSFYHLWYLPGMVMGAGIAYFLLRHMKMQVAGIAAALLYLIGLFGDSYYGAAKISGTLKFLYERLFENISYTRNGIFFVPLFLILGAAAARYETSLNVWNALFGFAASLAAVVFESLMTERLAWQYHDSMYLFLPLASFFLFEALLHIHAKERRQLRQISMWIYLLHPLGILFVRACFGVLKQSAFIVQHTFLFYLLVCVVSFALAFLADRCFGFLRTKFLGGKERV